MKKKIPRGLNGGRKSKYTGKIKILYMRIPESVHAKCVNAVEAICEPLKLISKNG